MATQTIEHEILQLSHDWMDAVRVQDRAAVERILADEFALTSTLPSAFDKQKYLQDMAAVSVNSFRFHDSSVRVYGDVVVVRTHLSWDASFDGKPWQGDFNITDVWVRRDGRWQVVTRHSSRPIAG